MIDTKGFWTEAMRQAWGARHQDEAPGAYMWGFGTSFDKASPFTSEDARDQYMTHVRGCPNHHDPRGIRFSRCTILNPDWFATDAAQGPE